MDANKKRYYPLRDEAHPNHVRLVEISEDQYKELTRDISRTRKRMQRLGQCVCPKNKLWSCDTHCFDCDFQAKNQISLDALIEGSDGISIADTINAHSRSPEDVVIDLAVLEALYKELDALDPEGRLMCRLFMNGLSERESAMKMGMPRSTFKLHWDKIKAELYKNLKEWRD